MKKRRRTEINLHLEEAIKIRPQSSVVVYCRGCRKATQMLPATEAAMITGFSTREIYRSVEDGVLHFTEDHNGLAFICCESLRLLVNRSTADRPSAIAKRRSEGEG